MAANLAKLSSESQDHGTNGQSGGHIPLMRKDSSLSNDVFESVDAEEPIVVAPTTRPDPLIEESGSSAATSPNVPDNSDVKIEHTILKRQAQVCISTNVQICSLFYDLTFSLQSIYSCLCMCGIN